MLQKIVKISLAGFFLSSAQAETSAIFKHNFSFGVETMKYFYKEPNTGQDEYSRQHGAVWTDSTGYLFGVNGSYRLTWKDRLFVQPEGRILYGKDDYRSGCKENIYLKTKREEPVFLYETRLLTGGRISFSDKLTFSPYSGIGYRFKNDDSEKVKCNDGRMLGYYRKSNYVYVPFGLHVDYAINNAWAVSLKGEYDWMIKGWQYSRRLPSTPRTYKQPNGYGLKGEVSISYLYKKVKFSVSPYIHYWNIRNSKIVTMPYPYSGAMEPYNITFESGMRLGVSF